MNKTGGLIASSGLEFALRRSVESVEEEKRPKCPAGSAVTSAIIQRFFFATFLAFFAGAFFTAFLAALAIFLSYLMLGVRISSNTKKYAHILGSC
jgi:hypothetical protein